MGKAYKERERDRNDLLEKGFRRLGWPSKHKFALGPLCEEGTDHPRKGKVPPGNIDKYLHKQNTIEYDGVKIEMIVKKWRS